MRSPGEPSERPPEFGGAVAVEPAALDEDHALRGPGQEAADGVARLAAAQTQGEAQIERRAAGGCGAGEPREEARSGWVLVNCSSRMRLGRTCSGRVTFDTASASCKWINVF